MNTGRYRRLLPLFILTTTSASVVHAQIVEPDIGSCGSLVNSYGPFDYRDPTRKKNLSLVEKFHFSGQVYRLERGMTDFGPAGDLDYTLRAFPNHHLALEAMARLHRRENAQKLDKANYTIRCYFQRARTFAPDDISVLLIEGIHFLIEEDLETAERALLAAIDINPKAAEVAYNLGLLYVRKGDFDRAKKYAIVAYDNGYPLPGLKNKLIERGVWPGKTDNVASR